MNRKIIVTEDNSKTLLTKDINQTYHSIHGAINESKHVFIQEGLGHLCDKNTIEIFEMGFGTGLNALLTLKYANSNNLSITYTTLDKFPLNIETIIEIDHCKNLNTKNLEESFLKMHTCAFNNNVLIHKNFNIIKIQDDIVELELKKNKYHIVYFDAFSPKAQPEVWSIKVLEKLYNSLLPNGILVTYCAQGQFKRNLKELGFEVNCPPGPPGKREMVRAVKKII